MTHGVEGGSFQRGTLSHTCTYERVLGASAFGVQVGALRGAFTPTPSPARLGQAIFLASDSSFHVIYAGNCFFFLETGESLLERWAASSSGEPRLSEAERLIPGLLRQSNLRPPIPDSAMAWPDVG